MKDVILGLAVAVTIAYSPAFAGATTLRVDSTGVDPSDVAAEAESITRAGDWCVRQVGGENFVAIWDGRHTIEYYGSLTKEARFQDCMRRQGYGPGVLHGENGWDAPSD